MRTFHVPESPHEHDVLIESLFEVTTSPIDPPDLPRVRSAVSIAIGAVVLVRTIVPFVLLAAQRVTVEEAIQLLAAPAGAMDVVIGAAAAFIYREREYRRQARRRGRPPTSS
jgi:hypothetical protein